MRLLHATRAAVAVVALVGLIGVGCPGDVDVDETFPCRAAEDCVEGFECHPARWICVPEGTAETADDGGPGDG